MSERRNARLRKEYLYRKSVARGKDGPVVAEVGRIEDGTADAVGVQRGIDDEYSMAGTKDPRILITTSRDPSTRLTQFAKELRLLVPNSQRMNRGNMQVEELVATCRQNEVTDLVVLHEHKGNPDGLVLCHLPYGPTAYFGVQNCVLRHDVKEATPMSQAYPHLLFHDMESKLGRRVQDILKHIFPVPKHDSRRVVTFANKNDFVSFRHHTYTKSGPKEVELTEVGPRFELKLYQIKLGTLDLPFADNEFVLRPYIRSAKRRQYLSASDTKAVTAEAVALK